MGVRFTDGLHFCTDPEYAAHGCIGERFQAGERRASAAIASQLIPVLAARAHTGTGAGTGTGKREHPPTG